jgi:hypothetical protein
MAQWAVVISPERFATERLFHHDTLAVDGQVAGRPVAVGDEVLVVVGGEKPVAVALGSARQAGEGGVVVAYLRRGFDEPVPADDLPLDGVVSPVEAEAFGRVVDRFGPVRDRRTWLVSLDLPIEASSPAEAVRQFWSYVTELGPQELPTFVSPSDDELAMQAFVLGAEAQLDPEEDDE